MRILLLVTMILFATSASAGLYKWVDEDGNVHYSQKRPIDKKFKSIKAPPPPPQDAKSPYQSIAPQNKPSGTVTAETDKNIKIRAENCERAKEKLKNFQIYRRVKDEDGNIKEIDEKMRSAQIQDANKAISDFCD